VVLRPNLRPGTRRLTGVGDRPVALLRVIAFVAFVSLGLPDGVLGVAWPSICRTFALPLSQLGVLLSAAAAGYLASSFASGWLVARIGVGRLLLFLGPYLLALAVLPWLVNVAPAGSAPAPGRRLAEPGGPVPAS
jgi:MFS family permease